MIKITNYVIFFLILIFIGTHKIIADNVLPANNYFTGKTITYIVSTKAGGGYDSYARLIAEYMEKYLGARIVIKNSPGAGHIVGTNLLYIAKPDGLTIGTFNTGLIYAQLMHSPGIEFDLRKLSWIGNATSDPRVIVVSKTSGITSVDDLRQAKAPTLFVASGVGSGSHNDMIFLTWALGIEGKVIPGFSGNEAQMSMIRGEITGTMGSYSSLRPFVDNNYGRFIVHIGGEDIFGHKLKAASSFAKDEDGRKLLSLVDALSRHGRLTAAPPRVPADRLYLLRQAYLLALKDPELLQRAESLNIPIKAVDGEDVTKFIHNALQQPDDLLETMNAAHQQHAER
ncbi:MAG: tripartite-type tricarboxylate transporter receptor subunit TctC [Planctomycetota bacterium]|jgi:tripartite-type tricarboxylate transporter receptor subunit TctC